MEIGEALIRAMPRFWQKSMKPEDLRIGKGKAFPCLATPPF
jgi:hypothetical protein